MSRCSPLPLNSPNASSIRKAAPRKPARAPSPSRSRSGSAGRPKPPIAELLVITDKDVWDYLPDEELAYQYSPEVVHDSRSIIQVITGQSRLDKDFTVEAEPDDNGLAVLRLYPKDPSPQLVEALLWVDKGTKLIKKAQILDFYGNTNEVALTSLTPDASIKAGTFQFTPPQGITVENLMNQDAPERPLLQ